MTMKKVVMIGTVEVYENRRANVFCKIQINESGELTISGVEGPLRNGNALGSCGQINMHLTSDMIEPAPFWDEWTIRRFLEMWTEWHLNHMRAGCEHQREAGETTISQKCGTCGYKYGHAWLKEDLPKYVETFMASLPDTDKTPPWV